MRRADNLTTFMCRLSCNLGASGPVEACNGIAFAFTKGKCANMISLVTSACRKGMANIQVFLKAEICGEI